MEIEIWKPVKDYEGYYEVSNLGRVKSLDNIVTQKNRFGNSISYIKKGRILKSKFKNIYDTVILCRNGIKTSYLVHRLVAFHFIPNPNNLPEVNHKDGNKQNPYYKNLEWCTSSYNQTHAIKTGLQKTSKGADHYQSKRVINIKTGIIYDSIFDASKSINKAYPYVSRMLHGKQINNTYLKFYNNDK